MFWTPSRLGRGAGAGFSSLLQTMRLISLAFANHCDWRIQWREPASIPCAMIPSTSSPLRLPARTGYRKRSNSAHSTFVDHKKHYVSFQLPYIRPVAAGVMPKKNPCPEAKPAEVFRRSAPLETVRRKHIRGSLTI
jgi:hypothetical protein